MICCCLRLKLFLSEGIIRDDLHCWIFTADNRGIVNFVMFLCCITLNCTGYYYFVSNSTAMFLSFIVPTFIKFVELLVDWFILFTVIVLKGYAMALNDFVVLVWNLAIFWVYETSEGNIFLALFGCIEW